ncbi:MAG: cytochrome C oxidase subunit II [Alphaproteobacteria bacterium BRH_c36]|nr:MAG: cytochrome C oxidase subunit II [Alphaproteobacteria bacterium BRH_c36]
MGKRLLEALPWAGLAGLAALALFAMSASAEVLGQSVDGQLGMQPAVTQVAQEIHHFYDLVNYIIIAVTLFVLGLLVYVMFAFRESRNPTPSRTTHNTTIEVLWTVLPIIILVIIAVPSFKLLNLQYSYPKADLTIKATGHQWYWSHEYPDQGGFAFDSYMLDDDSRKELIEKGLKAPRNLAVDNEVVVPVNKVVHVLVTAADVLHNWTVPAFGSKTDAVPGRLTATWFKAEREGVFYGQCSELCGVNHAFMPIAVRVVSQQTFDAWVEARKADDEDKAIEILRQAELEANNRKVATAAQ